MTVAQRYATTSEAAEGAAILSPEIPANTLPESAPKALPATSPATVGGETIDPKKYAV